MFSKCSQTGKSKEFENIFIDFIYRPGQANWENTLWQFQILHEINFSQFEALKTAILNN